MKRIIETLRSRRGVAMELALVVMFVVLALSIVLVNNATLQKSNKDASLERIENLELYSAAERLLAGQTVEGYTISNSSIDGDGTEEYVVTCTETGAKLTVTVNSENKKITSWVVTEE